MAGATVQLVVVGASLGGLEAVGSLLAALPAAFGPPLVIVHHCSADTDSSRTAALRARSPLPLEEAEDKMPLQPGHVYLAPPGYHLLVEDQSLALSTEAPVGYSRPSIDVCFESAAQSYGPGVVGVVLTGANNDGAAGAAAIKRYGGRVLVQDPATADTATMPAATLAAVQADGVGSPAALAALLTTLTLSGGGHAHARRLG